MMNEMQIGRSDFSENHTEEEVEPPSNSDHHFKVHGRSVTVLFFYVLSLYVFKSCDFFAPTSTFRRFSVWLVEWSLWEYIILLLTIANTILLLAYDYTDRNVQSSKNKLLEAFELVLTFLYAFEAIIKVVAMGFYEHRRSYLRTGWNVFDLFIVFIGLLDPFLHDYYGMKLFRVTRLLKFAYTSKGMKSLLEPLVVSVVHLPDVALYLLVLLLAFAIIGTFQFQGSFYYRCRVTPEPVGEVWEIDRNVKRFCSAYGMGDYECPSNRYCGHPNMYGLTLKYENFSDMVETYYGAVGYDTVPKALLANIQILTFEAWNDIMYKMSDTMNSIFARIFFPVLIYVCAFFALNLIVAVIVDALLKNRQQNQPESEPEPSPSKSSPGAERDVSLQRPPSRLELTKMPLPQGNSKTISEVPHDHGNENQKDCDSQHGKQGSDPVPGVDSPRTSVNLPVAVPINQNSQMTITEVQVPIKVSNKSILNTFISIVVVANIITMSLDRLGISDEEIAILDIFDTVFFSIFVLEMTCKMWLEGFFEYFNESSNVTDAIINFFGVIEVALTYSPLCFDYGVRGAIVILRVTRVAKLVDKWNTLRETLTFVWCTISDIINFLILLALFVFMYAIIGMELFAEKAKFNSNDMFDLKHGASPRYNFDCLRNALIASYTLVIGENWSTYLYMYTRLNHTVGIVYFYTGIFMMNVFLVNVFLAIVLQNFYVDEQKKKWEEEERKNKEYAEKIEREAKEFPDKGYKNRERTLLTALKMFRTVISLNKMCKEKNKKPKSLLIGQSFIFFGEDSKFRLISYRIVNSTGFTYLTYLFTIISSVVITFRTPLHDPSGPIMTAVYITDSCLAACFCMEILLKSIAYGFFFNGEESYLRNPWNILDAVSTLALILQLGVKDASRTMDQVIMLFRMLRVLRLVNIREGFKLSIQAIVKGFPSIMQTLGVGTLFFFVLSVIGVHFFKGMLYYCERKNIGEFKEEITDVYDCMNYGGEWKNSDISFDNMLMSLMTLFELMTAKSWWMLVIGLTDNYGIDKEPKEYSNTNTAWFVVLCTIVGFLYIRAIITGLINFAFCKQKEEIQGVTNLAYAQRKWVNFSKVIFKAAPIKVVFFYSCKAIVPTRLQVLQGLPNIESPCVSLFYYCHHYIKRNCPVPPPL